VFAGSRIEDQDRPLKTAIAIGAQVTARDVAPAQMDEQRFPPVVQPSVSEHVPNVVDRQISLRQSLPGVLRDDRHSRFTHLPSPPARLGSAIIHPILPGSPVTSSAVLKVYVHYQRT
jgi:hypothetical protein